MGRRAEQRFEELFTSEQMAVNYTALYHELVARRAVKPSGAIAEEQGAEAVGSAAPPPTR